MVIATEGSILSTDGATSTYPLSLPQEAIWLDQLFNQGTVDYAVGMVFRIDGPLDVERLRQAIEAVVQHHDALRVVLTGEGGTAMQRIQPAAAASIDFEDMSAEPGADEAAQATLRERINFPFDLYAGPLSEARLIRVNAQRHYWLLRFHHLIVDGPSFPIILRAVAERYGNPAGSGRAAAGSDFLTFVAADQAYRTSAQFAEDRRYWRERFDRIPQSPLAVLCRDGARATAMREREYVCLPRHELERIEAAGSSSGLTRTQFFLGVLAVCLSRMTGETDVILGLPFHNRSSHAARRAVGMLSSVAPIELRIDHHATFAAILQSAWEELKAGAQHSRLSLARINRELPLRQSDRRQVFDVALSVESWPLDVELGAASCRVLNSYRGAQHAPLAVSIIDYHSEGDIEIELAYDPGVLAAETVRAVGACLVQLTESCLAEPHAIIADLSMLEPQALEQVVVQFNSKAKAPADSRLLHELFEQQVERGPRKKALAGNGRSVSYSELDAMANDIAVYLQSEGVGHQSRVAICAHRSIELVAAVLGILKAGAVYVPLDPDAPAQRLARMLEDCAASLVFTAQTLRDLLPEAVPSVALDSEWERIAARRRGTAKVSERFASTELAYVIYTSGSTGEPKGVAGTHAGMVNRVLAQEHFDPLADADICCQKTSIGFVDSIFEMLGPLTAGCETVIAPAAATRDLGALAGLIEQEAVTRLVSVPSLAQALLDAGLIDRLSGLRSWTLSGETLRADLLRRLQRSLPNCRLVNLYGSSEVAADATYFCASDWDGGSVPIGQPLRNNRIYILDAARRPAAVGMAGEIYVAGAGVARGYLNLPELTAARFVPDPFLAQTGERMFRTGDLGRWRADGLIEFIGRNDRQVKIRGIRIELSEIEATLQRQSGIKEVVVSTRTAAGGETQLIAYLTFLEAPLATEALRAAARSALPGYMVPQCFVALEHLPRTTSGKIDMGALPAPTGRIGSAVNYEAPEGALEQRFAAIWSSVLGVQRVGRHDNFFDLGGHSLMIVQTVEQLRQAGYRVEPADVFESPTLADLCELILSRPSERVAPARLPGSSGGSDPASFDRGASFDARDVATIVQRTPGGQDNIQSIQPLTPWQEGLLFHHVLGDRGDTYVFPMLLVADSRSELDRFIAGLQQVVDRHDALRTVVHWEDLSIPAQVVWRHARIVVDEQQMDGSAADVLRHFKEQMRPEGLRLDLRQAPLLRVRIAPAGGTGRWYALLLLHHLVSDHASQFIALREITAQLDGYEKFTAAPSYSEALAQALNRAQPGEADRHFRDRLADVDEPTLPFGLADTRGDGSQLGETRESLNGDLAQQLRDCARLAGVSVASLFHLAWGAVVAHASSRDDVVFGSVLSARLQGAMDGVVGMMVNTLPLRMRLRGCSVATAVTTIQRELAELMRHQHASLLSAQSCSGVDRGSPLFSAVLNYRPVSAAQELEIRNGLARHGVTVLARSERSNYPLVLYVDDTQDDFTLTVQSDRRVDAGRVLGYARTLLGSLVQSLAADPQRQVLDLEMLSSDERMQLLARVAPRHHAAREEPLLHQLFERRVRVAPDAVALTFEGRELSYAELNQRANHLAHVLRGMHVGPDVIVGLCLERGLELMIGVLGILKAGGAYLPLDPNYPQERLEFMLRDASPRLILTTDALRGRLSAASMPVITIDADWAALSGGAATDPDASAMNLQASHLAYVIYTSGSTGAPKGVMVEHRNVSRLFAVTDELFACAETDVWTLYHSYAFDFSVWEMWGALLKGGRLVIVPHAITRSPEEFYRLLCDQGVTVLNQTPSAFSLLVAAQANLLHGAEHRLRLVIFGGESLQLSSLVPWAGRQCNAHTTLVNMYGITETTVHVTHYELSTDDIHSERGNPIGAALSDLKLYILDPDRRLAPIGATGEIHVGGGGVARGYLNREQLTAERFVPDPFDPTPGARMYRTGDVALRREDGVVEYVGRNDKQVKIRGFRIEPGEIEAQIFRLRGIKQAVVVTQAFATGDHRLVAYVAPMPRAREGESRGQFKMPNGMVVHHLNDYETRQIFDEVFVRNSYLKHGVSLDGCECVFDVGANIGLFSLFASNLQSKARIFAFEPAPPAYECLQRNAELYQLPVTALPCGLSDSERDAVFHYYPRMSANSGVYADADAERNLTRQFLQNLLGTAGAAVDEIMERKFEAEAYACTLKTISQIIDEYAVTRIDLLKIDVEKSEWDILRGIEERHWGLIRQIVIEVHDFDGRVGKVLALLEMQGFRCEIEQEHQLQGTELYQVYATRAPNGASRNEGAGAPIRIWPSLSELEPHYQVEVLRAKLAQSLPGYMVPAAYVLLETLPTTPSGKVDRARLPAPEESDTRSAQDSEIPRHGAEQVLAALWQSLLGVRRVGRWDNFFELGGHSLLIMKLVEGLRHAGYRLLVRDVFETPSLAGLAGKLQSLTISRLVPGGVPADCDVITPGMVPLARLDDEQIATVVSRVPGTVGNVQDIYPLTALQEGILFHHLLNAAADTYVLAILMEADSLAQLDALLAALQQVIDRHDILRTAIQWEGLPHAVQVVHRQARLPVERLQLSQGTEPLVELRSRMQPENLKFDLRDAPLLRMQVAEDPADGRCYALLSLHHIIADHVGLEIILAEMRAIVAGRAASLSMPLAYRDFVAHALADGRSEAAEQFFRRRLGDVVEPTAPFGFLDVHGDGSRILEHRQMLDSAASVAVRNTARRHGISTAAIWHAAWAIVVGRCSGRDDVVFGSVLLGRLNQRENPEQLVGMLINTLPLRIDLAGLSVERLVQQVQGAIAELVEHEQASLALAQRCSGITSGAPLFSALLNYRHSSVQTGQRTDVAGARVLEVQERTNYPFTLSVDDLGQGFVLTLRTDREIDPARIAGYVCRVLASMLSLLDEREPMPVAQIEMLADSERRQLLEDFNVRTGAAAPVACLHALFESTVDRLPDAVAVIFGERTLSFSELNGRANRLARWLREQGVGREQRVALHMPRSWEMLVAMFAVLKAGGAYVPMDPGYPRQRLQHMLEDSTPTLVLSHSSCVALLPDAIVTVALIDQLPDTIGASSGKNLEQLAGSSAEDLAYVIYTSGSTGRPKGVMVEHRNVTNYAVDIIERFAVEEGVGSLVATSLCFDLALTGVFPPLLCGRSVRLCPDEPDALARELTSCRDLAPVKITPSHLRVLSDSIRVSQLPGRVRVLVLGGEALSLESLTEWRELASGTRLFNHYGPTECTVGCAAHEITGRDPGTGLAPIGRPIANARIYILDRHLRPVPLGVAGEIVIGGPCVARGYLNLPEATASAFVPDPFVEDSTARMYRSGDLGRWRADGEVEYLGRRDQQVKVRGFRVELAEVEMCLMQHAGVREAVVVATQAGEQRLIAYVTCHDPVPGAEALRAHAKNSLPDYMVPSAYVVLEAIPLNANGKVDRSALPEPGTSAYSRSAFEAPRTPLEMALAGLWRELLSVDRIGRHDNFYELGGHSLLMMRMMVSLGALGVSTDVRTLFSNATLADLAQALESRPRSGFELPTRSVPPGCERIHTSMLPLASLSEGQIERIVATVPGGALNVQDIYPLSPLQEGILFHHLLQEQSDVYVLPLLLEAESHAVLTAFLDALQSVIRRHDILRTAIVWEGLPQPMQVVYREAALPVENLDIAGTADPLEQMQRRLQPECLRMDLTRPPLVRATVGRDPRDHRCYCLVQFHHLVKDHVSLQIIREELRALLEGRGSQLGQPTPYRNFVARSLWQAKQVDAEAFFRRKLGEVEEPTAPFGLLDVHGDGSRIEQHRESLEPALSGSIRRLVRGLGVSAATVFHAAWAIVVGRCSGREDVVFGTVLLGRWQQSAGAERAVGMFMNTLPLRVRLGEARVGELVEQVHREIVELLDYDQASLALAQRCSAIAGAAPLFTALFNYRHSSEDAASWQQPGRFAAGMRLVDLREVTSYPLSFSVDDLDGEFILTAQTDPRIDARRVSGYLHTVLKALVRALEREPDTRVAELPMLSDPELQQLIGRFSSEPAQPAGSGSIHGLFESQAASTPQALAVVCGPEQLTYEQLNRRANQLAHRLRAAGVGPDDLVALCMQRSVDMMVALLGVLKAGGAYVPLDPTWPTQRLRRILEDAGARLVVCDAGTVQPIQGLGLPTLSSSTSQTQSANEADANLELSRTSLAGRSLAYVVYTSGSTGEPKGVMVEHHGAISFWRAMEARVHSRAPGSQRVGMNAPLNFDASVQQWMQLLSGRTLVIIDEETRRSPHAFVEFVRSSRLEILDGVPSQLALLVGAGLLDAQRTSLRLLVAGGEAIGPQLWRQFAQASQLSVFNVYGPTECTVNVTAALIDENSVPNIGKPLAHARIYILDSQGRPVPERVVGEIYVGGPAVARGYRQGPGLTDSAFVPDPFVPGGRMYRTGDLARWRGEDVLEYVGRADQQVKIRGMRVEIGEIEALVRRFHGVTNVAVLPRADESGTQQLVAYFSAGRANLPSAADLRTFLREHLPEHMVPAAYVGLEALPLMGNGKLDRQALPAPDEAAFGRRSFESPQGAVEKELARLWSQLLNVPQVGRHDNFFDLGGHSLFMMQLIVQVRESFELDLRVRTLFENPTLTSLAASIEVLQSARVPMNRGAIQSGQLREGGAV